MLHQSPMPSGLSCPNFTPPPPFFYIQIKTNSFSFNLSLIVPAHGVPSLPSILCHIYALHNILQIYFTYCANNLFTHWTVSAYVSGDGAAEQGNSLIETTVSHGWGCPK